MKHTYYLSLIVFAVGCGQSTFTTVRQNVKSDIVRNEVTPSSIEAFKSIPDYSEFQNTLFIQLNLASLYFYAQNFDSSIYYFNEAESKIEDQYTRRVSQEIGSILTNQYNVDYQSYPIEHLLIHFYKSLAYLQKNDLESAVVETRKLQQKLAYLEEFSGFYQVKQTDFPFLNYYSGLIFHIGGEENDARVSFKFANFDYDELKKTFPPVSEMKLHLIFSGLIPELEEAYIRLLVSTDDDIYTLKVAYPVFFNPYSDPFSGELKGSSEPVRFNISEKFENEFDAKEKELEPKNFARVATKFILANGTAALSEKMMDKRKEEKNKEKEEKKKKGEKVDSGNQTSGEDILWGTLWFLGNVMKVVNDVTEKADLRQWFLLPSDMTLVVASKTEETQYFKIIQSDRLTLEFIPPKRIREFNEEQYQKTINFNFQDDDKTNKNKSVRVDWNDED